MPNLRVLFNRCNYFISFSPEEPNYFIIPKKYQHLIIPPNRRWWRLQMIVLVFYFSLSLSCFPWMVFWPGPWSWGSRYHYNHFSVEFTSEKSIRLTLASWNLFFRRFFKKNSTNDADFSFDYSLLIPFHCHKSLSQPNKASLLMATSKQCNQKHVSAYTHDSRVIRITLKPFLFSFYS